jgi:hypothetical protein
MPVRRLLPIGASLVALAFAFATLSRPSGDGRGLGSSVASAATIPLRADPAIGPFQGLGVWVDIYDAKAWQRPGRAVRSMAAHGVKTLYLETSNYRNHSAFVHKTRAIDFIDAAHRFGVNIVAWYLPAFRHTTQDVRRVRAAIKLVTPNGHSFDGFALDIEASLVRDPSNRTNRLLRESDAIREIAGATYPLGAIIPPPKRVLITDPTYWPHFPFRGLAARYDAMIPMTYFTYTTSGKDAAHRYTDQAIDLIRREVGSKQVPIHVIGGLAQVATSRETEGFVQAIREHGIVGASYYTFPGVTRGQWRQLVRIPANPVETPAAPLHLGAAAVGNITGGDQTHPREAVFRTDGKRGKWRLSADGFDVQSGEVKVFSNWHFVDRLSAGPSGDWTGEQTVPIPSKYLKDRAPNYIAFVATGAHPVWGVRNVSIAPA